MARGFSHGIGYNLRVAKTAGIVAVALTCSAAVARAEERNSELSAWKLGQARRLDLAVDLGFYRRIDEPPAFELEAANALGGGVEVRAFLARRMALQLGWERFGLGRDSTALTDFGTARIGRKADAAWLGLRLDPWANDSVATFVALAAGTAWQHANAAGALWPEQQPGFAQPFECTATGVSAPGLRAEFGTDVRLGAGLGFFAAASFAVLGFADGPIDGCGSGAGSTQMFALRSGLSYSFELGAGDG
jgi:hypothetical protein